MSDAEKLDYMIEEESGTTIITLACYLLPYLLESNAHHFQWSVVYKFGVRIRVDEALDSHSN